MGPIHYRPKIPGDLGVASKTPIVNQKNLVTIDFWRRRFIDNKRALQAARHLFPCFVVRMIPVCSGIRCGDVVEKLFAGRHRFLSEFWHTIHRIDNPDAMPVNCGRLWQLIDELAAKPRPVLFEARARVSDLHNPKSAFPDISTSRAARYPSWRAESVVAQLRFQQVMPQLQKVLPLHREIVYVNFRLKHSFFC